MACEDIYLMTASTSWVERSMIRDVNLYSDDIKPHILQNVINNQMTPPSKTKKNSNQNKNCQNNHQCEICTKRFTKKFCLEENEYPCWFKAF